MQIDRSNGPAAFIVFDVQRNGQLAGSILELQGIKSGELLRFHVADSSDLPWKAMRFYASEIEIAEINAPGIRLKLGRFQVQEVAPCPIANELAHVVQQRETPHTEVKYYTITLTNAS